LQTSTCQVLGLSLLTIWHPLATSPERYNPVAQLQEAFIKRPSTDFEKHLLQFDLHAFVLSGRAFRSPSFFMNTIKTYHSSGN
jgi:hypothetical protein